MEELNRERYSVEMCTKSRNHLIFNTRDLFTRVYWSIFFAQFPASWRKELLIFSCSKGTISWFLFQIKQKYRTTIKYFCRDFVQPTWLLSLLPPFWVGNKATRARLQLTKIPLVLPHLFRCQGRSEKTFARGRKKSPTFFGKSPTFFQKRRRFFWKRWTFSHHSRRFMPQHSIFWGNNAPKFGQSPKTL